MYSVIISISKRHTRPWGSGGLCWGALLPSPTRAMGSTLAEQQRGAMTVVLGSRETEPEPCLCEAVKVRLRVNDITSLIFSFYEMHFTG